MCQYNNTISVSNQPRKVYKVLLRQFRGNKLRYVSPIAKMEYPLNTVVEIGTTREPCNPAPHQITNGFIHVFQNFIDAKEYIGELRDWDYYFHLVGKLIIVECSIPSNTRCYDGITSLSYEHPKHPSVATRVLEIGSVIYEG